MNIEQVPEKE